jgi:hypothetical protein
MANWSNPTITTQYDVFVNEAKDRDVDSATMFLNVPTGAVPVGAVMMARVSPTAFTFREFNGIGFGEKTLHLTGGGTSATEPVAARANLGIGTMGVQNSNAVAITGGTIYNLSGLSISCSIVFNANAAYDLGSNGSRVRRGYFSDALVLPSGVDKFATS